LLCPELSVGSLHTNSIRHSTSHTQHGYCRSRPLVASLQGRMSHSPLTDIPSEVPLLSEGACSEMDEWKDTFRGQFPLQSDLSVTLATGRSGTHLYHHTSHTAKEPSDDGAKSRTEIPVPSRVCKLYLLLHKIKFII